MKRVLPRGISLRMRIGILLFAGVLCTGAGLHVLLINLTRQRLLAELRSRSQGFTNLLASRLGTPLVLQDHTEMRDELGRAFQEPEVIGVVVYDGHGREFDRVVRDPKRWVADEDLGPRDSPENHAHEEAELRRLRVIEAESPIVRDATQRQNPMDEARELYGLEEPQVPDDARLGWVRALYATDSVEGAVADAARMSITALAAALALWLLPLFALLRFIAEPLREASDLARAIATGELERRIPVRSPDELGTLAASLNTMAAALTQSREQTRMEAESMRRATEAMVSIAGEARESRGVDEVFDVVAAHLRGLTGSSAAVLALPDLHERVKLERFDPPLPWGDLVSGQFLDRDLAARMTAQCPRPVVADLAFENVPVARGLLRDGFRRLLLVPLTGTGGASGAILLLSQEIDAFPPAQIEVVTGLATHLGAAVHAATLRTRLESAVAELEKTRERLEHSERLRMAGEMASGVAHDFNNVLGAILGRAQLLRRRAQSGELSPNELIGALHVIERAAADGGDTVRRLRQFGPAGHARETERVDLDEAMRGAAEFTRTRWEDEAQAQGRPIRMEIDSAPGAVVEGRGSEMREIFTNMILNAVDALPRGGRIHLATRVTTDRVVATISDDGVGMAPEVQKRIFDPFFTTKGEGGTGLGLSVVYGIVQNAGGSIAVESAPGMGTTLRLELPVAQGGVAPAVAAVAVVPVAPASVDSLRVMVVDDEPAVRELLHDILQSLGHAPESFESGGRALDRFEPGRFELLFTDLGMPGMTGWELARAVRARDPEVTIAIITGWGAEVSMDSVREAGADTVIAKPFTIEDIEGLVQLVRERREKRAA